jgi:hypothetical protein
MRAYLRVGQSRGVARRVPETPGVPDSDAGLRAANARLRELLAERDTRIAEQDAEVAVPREHLAGLQSQVADLAARMKANSRNSSRPPRARVLRGPVLPRHRRPSRHQRPRRLTRAFQASPWIPEPGNPARHQSAPARARIAVQGTDLPEHRELAFPG